MRYYPLLTNISLNLSIQAQYANFATAKFRLAKDIPADVEKQHMNLFQSVNNALDIALATDKT